MRPTSIVPPSLRRLLPAALAAAGVACSDVAAPGPEPRATPEIGAASAAAAVAATWTRSAEALPAPAGVAFTQVEHVTVDAAGRVHAVFTARTSSALGSPYDQVLYARYEGGRWTAPERLSTPTPLVFHARVGVDGAGKVHVFWYQHVDGSLSYAATDLLHRAWDGRAWSEAESLYRTAEHGLIPASGLDVTTDRTGAVHVLFCDLVRGYTPLVQTASGWQRGTLMNDHGIYPSFASTSPTRGLEVAIVGSGFSPSPRFNEGNTIVVRSFRGGAWSEPGIVAVSPDLKASPLMVTDSRGVQHVVYGQGVVSARSGRHVGPSRRIRYARSEDGGRTWSEPADVLPLPDAADPESSPMVSLLGLYVDASDRLHLLTVYRGLRYMTRVGDAWSDPAPLPVNALPDGVPAGTTHQGFQSTVVGGTVHAVFAQPAGFVHATLSLGAR